jgi:2-isopropylmalate synthase
VDPGVDFSDLDRVRRVYEHCTGQEVPKRHPYAGELVYTAFSGTHQDAINKGFEAARRKVGAGGLDIKELPWEVPYLPIDPEDVGRSYDEVVRVNSQSGKGGIAYVMSTWHGLHLPRGLQIEFAGVVQSLADAEGTELTPERIRRCFEDEYQSDTGRLTPFPIPTEPVAVTLFVEGAGAVRHDNALRTLAATLGPWGIDVQEQHLIGTADHGRDGDDVIKVYAACRIDGETVWGAGIDRDVHVSAFAAVRAATGRANVQIPEAAPLVASLTSTRRVAYATS